MKQGSGDDPFADLEDDGGEDEPASQEAESDSEVESESEAVVGTSEGAGSTGGPLGSDARSGAGADSGANASSSTKERYTDSGSSATEAGGDETGGSDSDASDSAGTAADVPEADGQTKAEADGIPWVLRRSRVKEDRGNVHQFFLREEYSAREDEIIEAVASELDMRQKDLQKLDVREAMVAAADPEDVAAVLREWGYEYLK